MLIITKKNILQYLQYYIKIVAYFWKHLLFKITDVIQEPLCQNLDYCRTSQLTQSIVHYQEYASYARLRIRVVSQPFCLRGSIASAGFNVSNKENFRFIPAPNIIAEADLLPTTLTSSSAIDPDYAFPLRILRKMKKKIHTLKLQL